MSMKISDFSVQTEITPELDALYDECQEKLYDFNQTRPSEKIKRKAMLKEIIGTIDDTTIIPPFRCDLGVNISFGQGGFCNYGLTILDIAPVTIGSNVLIGPNVQICGASHPALASERTLPIACGEPITIGDNSWIGGGAIVLGGVTIGENTVIGAGSIVTKNIPDNVIAVGNPCRVIKQLPDGKTAKEYGESRLNENQ
ncbi:sugar O-acetyltransferase [Vibrio sp. ZSDE26]|uniref:Acetyltransferase n=1 Tax=Vibrio amylolyticus TaxID=2847292 RepID=A0A9X2BHC6_9VIBR|nr:sugar O-acetyltransferase [Vibrio amylolyticus]MCK6263659.1 sugar O-acetyltransferase [Vibrio amylolyticus]